MSASTVFAASPQVVVHGGGIAGLWILRELLARGLDAVLVESDELGAAQTVASQGVIHGGVKYALNGVLTDSSEAIRDMPGRWAQSMRGEGAVGLQGVGVLSDHQVLWSSATITGRLTTFFASRALSSRLSRVEAAALPEAFHHPAFKGSVYRIEEQVLDIPSVIRALAAPVMDRILAVRGVEFESAGGEVRSATFDTEKGGVGVRGAVHVFAAGAGNEALLGGCGLPGLPRTQRRPLHQVMVRLPHLPSLYGVCMGGGPKPLLVATTHRPAQGGVVWYLGGELAESGVNRDPAAQIVAARERLDELFPWMDWTGAQWATWRGDRAEPARDDGARAPGAVAVRTGNVITAWPSKLALAPALADQVMVQLPELAPASAKTRFPDALPRPVFARPPWETAVFTGG